MTLLVNHKDKTRVFNSYPDRMFRYMELSLKWNKEYIQNVKSVSLFLTLGIFYHIRLVLENHIRPLTILKKKVKSKGNNSKKPQAVVPPPPLFKKPSSPIPSTSTTPDLKLSPTKISSKVPKISAVTTTSSTPTVMTTTTTKSETRVSSSSTHSSKSSSVHSPKSPSKSTSSSVHSPKSLSKTVPTTEPTASMSTSTSNSSSSSRHKKSRKSSSSSSSSSKIAKEFDPDVHCGVVEGNRGPCTRSITCSNHRIQLRKLVSGRSKDIHQLIAERKVTKEKEFTLDDTSSSYMSPKGEEQDALCQSTSYVPIVATIVGTIDSTSSTTTYIPIMPKTDSPTAARQTSTSVITTKQLNSTDMENKSSTLDSGYVTNVHNTSQEGAIGTVPVVYMPMSPISVVSPVQEQDESLQSDPLKFVQIGKNMICLESPQSAMSPPLTSNQSVLLTIPSQQSSMNMYKSHPKPVVIPFYSTKKVGGAVLLSSPQVECQRSDILSTMNTRRETVNNSQGYRSLLNHTASPHRPNILKSKNSNKTNGKRPATEKLNANDSKQLKLSPNVNGFMAQSDVSESADAPQSNNTIQEKIALLNMK
ncbi:hypothetical protein NQ317_009992 [Molorchus minor]|uniref:SCA7 domain-containing protein n=1 Tax=Molorchus minor TaxID=1323400 RepID=A0ABQ9K8B2_9CUCU|nr:hypothetical protein NQ317_009992 [Molorchus minor]